MFLWTAGGMKFRQPCQKFPTQGPKIFHPKSLENYKLEIYTFLGKNPPNYTSGYVRMQFWQLCWKFLAHPSSDNFSQNPFAPKFSSKNRFWEYQFLPKIVNIVLKAGFLAHYGACAFKFSTFILSQFWPTVDRKYCSAAALLVFYVSSDLSTPTYALLIHGSTTQTTMSIFTKQQKGFFQLHPSLRNLISTAQVIL